MLRFTAALLCALSLSPVDESPADGPPLASQDPPAADGPGDPEALVDRLVRVSPITWDADIPALHTAMAADPGGMIEALVARLADDTQVPGQMLESQIYGVGGNALTLLERLTDERICGLGSDWIGFSTHDHRSPTVDTSHARSAWRAWLEVRADVPADEWFWGLSYTELRSLSTLMRTLPKAWPEDSVAAVETLGARAYPYLLDKLVDNEHAVSGRQFCTQANALLQRLTGEDHGEILALELLRIRADDPERKERRVLWRNQASRVQVQRRWMAALVRRR